MPYFGSTYKNDIEPIIKDWLTNSRTGQNVSDLPLSLANRAQRNLWAKKPWSNMVERVALSLVGATYTFPADFGRIIDIWADLTGTGTASYWYYDSDSYERGYRLDAGFTKGSGYARTITFNYAQTNSSYMRYQKVLADFTGDADNAEYSFFPAELLILEIQKINSLEKGNIKEYNGFVDSFKTVFNDFQNSTQWINYNPNASFNDRYGIQAYTDAYSLGGGGNRTYSELPNSWLP